jgi:hypothetical protein
MWYYHPPQSGASGLLYLTLDLYRYNIHYDIRYTKKPLEEQEQHDAIVVLIQTYLATFRDLGIQTWLMHGTLLGWWWGKKVCDLYDEA